MNKFYGIGGALIGLMMVSGNALAVERTFDLDKFKEIRIDARANLDVSVGGKQSVKIDADQEILDKLNVVVKGDTLVIKHKKNRHHDHYSRGKSPKVTISMALLEKLTINGSSDAKIDGIKGKIFALRINGSGDVNFSGKSTDLDISINGSGDVKSTKYHAENIDASINGSGDVFLAGKCKSLDLGISGSGDFSGKDFKCADVRARISGSGDVVTYASQSLDMRSSGSSDMDVYGDPKTIKNRSSGSSELNVH